MAGPPVAGAFTVFPSMANAIDGLPAAAMARMADSSESLITLSRIEALKELESLAVRRMALHAPPQTAPESWFWTIVAVSSALSRENIEMALTVVPATLFFDIDTRTRA